MTQDLTLGITAGSSQTVAVIAADSGRTSRFTVRTRPTAPGLTPDLARTLPARVGDPVDIRADDGRAVAPADLLAETIGATVREIEPASTVAAFPAWWSAHAVRTQRDALDRADLSDVVLVPEPAAAVRWLEDAHDITEGTTVVVYDLGATGVTVSVADTGPTGGPRGESLRSTTVSGDEFDLLIMRYVLANAVGDNDFDPFDPAVEQELAIVRQRGRNAKEVLSGNTATSIQVRLPGITREVRLVRDELEELFRGPLLTSVELIGEAMHRAGVDRGSVGRILLTGGGASIPLVTELISTEFGIPVLAAENPAHTSASGAALLAAELLAETTVPEAALLVAAAHSAAAEPVPAGSRAVAAPDLPEPAKTPVLPELPQDTTPDRAGSRRRVILIAAAAIAAAALATGTLALGTTTPTTSSPAAVGNTTTSSGTTAPNTTPGGATASRGAATSAAPGAAVASAAPAANSATTPNAHNGPTPTSANAAPAANTPPPPGTPATQPPAPQTNSTQPPNSQPPVTVITIPAAPTIPSAPLGNSGTNPLNRAGNTLGTVLQVPNKILPQTGK